MSNVFPTRTMLKFSRRFGVCVLAIFAAIEYVELSDLYAQEGRPSRDESRGGGGAPPWMNRDGDGGGPPAEGGPGGGRGGGGRRGGFGEGGGGGGPWGGGGGGPWGGGAGGGGPWGGGGFDPAAMLSRLDINGNKMIDPDEMQGPARFMIDRMARDNPKIDVTKPIPLSILTEGIGGQNDEAESGEIEDEPLVPGFDNFTVLPAPPGFGKDGELESIRVQEIDTREAAQRISAYDRNGDGALDEDELRRGRWNDNPMQYDRNHDGKLQAAELAVRYARQRTQNSDKKPNETGDDRDSVKGRGWAGNDFNNQDQPLAEKTQNSWQDRASYRVDIVAKREEASQGLPNWFTAADANGDSQVSMQEFTSDWDETQIAEFDMFDASGDGYVSRKECLSAIKRGVIRGSSGSMARSSDSNAASSTSSRSSSSSSSSSGSAFSLDGLPDDAEEKWVTFVAKRLEKVDADRNGSITVNEWSASDGEFNKVDTSGDGLISLPEAYQFKMNQRK